jgi:hypothetical protein
MPRDVLGGGADVVGNSNTRSFTRLSQANHTVQGTEDVIEIDNDLQTRSYEIQITGDATGGTFTATFHGPNGDETTPAQAIDVDGSVFRDALEALPSIEPGDLRVDGSTPNTGGLQVVFLPEGQYAYYEDISITVDDALATGGEINAAVPVEVTPGVVFIKLEADVPIPVGFEFEVWCLGSQPVTVVARPGVTWRGSGSGFAVGGIWAEVSFITPWRYRKVGPDLWTAQEYSNQVVDPDD